MTPKIIVAVCCWLVFISIFFTQAYITVLPVISSELDVKYTMLQMVFYANILFFGISQFIYGLASDIYGNKNILLFGLAIACIGNILSAFAINFSWLFAGHCLVGVGAGSASVIPRAILKDEVPSNLLIKSILIMSITSTFAMGLAPITGGLIQSLLGWRSLHLLLAITALISLIFTSIAITSHFKRPKKPIKISHSIRNYIILFKDITFIHNIIPNSGGYAAIIIYLISTPIIFQNTFGYATVSNSLVYLLCSTSYLVANLVLIRFYADNSSYMYTMIGIFCSLSGTALLAASVYLNIGPIQLIVAGILIYFGSGLITPLTFRRILNISVVTSGVASGGISATRVIIGFLLCVVTTSSLQSLKTSVLLTCLIFAVIILSFFYTYTKLNRLDAT